MILNNLFVRDGHFQNWNFATNACGKSVHFSTDYTFPYLFILSVKLKTKLKFCRAALFLDIALQKLHIFCSVFPFIHNFRTPH
jgi:hypothetical protein